MKLCRRCKQEKPLEAFSPSRRTRKHAWCRACESADRLAWEHRTTTPERKEARSEYLKQWRAEHPGYQPPAHAPDVKRSRRLANIERYLGYEAKWRDANRDVIRDRDRQRSRENPAYFAYKSAKRRARKAQAAGSHTEEEWQEVLRRYKFKCAHCCARGTNAKRGRLTKDHIIPLARGGTDYAFNLQPLCQPCNSRKNARIAPGTQHSLFDGINEEDAS